MALGVTARGSNTNTASANPLNVSPSGNFAAGSFGVLCVTADNASSGGATNDLAASMNDSLGNVWTKRTAPIFDNGAASAGIQGAIYTSPCAAGAPQTSTTIPISSGVAAPAKGWSLYEITHASNAEVAYVTGNVNAGATSSAPTVTTSSIPVGDCVIAAYHSENVGATTQDGDTTNGSWTAQVTVTAGSTTSGIRHSTQTKIQTTTASTQTFNPTTASTQDCILSWIQLHEQHTADSSLALMTGGGVISHALTSARTRSAALATGGGVEAVAPSSSRTRSASLATGGGVAVEAPTTNRLAAPTETGGGVLAVDVEVVSVENHDATFAATGGGVTTEVASGQRAGAIGATGGGVAVSTATTDHPGTAQMTGAGTANPSIATDRPSEITATGSGAFTQSVAAARQFALLLSGGGVLATDLSTARTTHFGLTGGGIADITIRLGEDHEATFDATGGGVTTFVIESDRYLVLGPTGGGMALFDLATARFARFSATGAGRVDIDTGAVLEVPDTVVWTASAGIAVSTIHVDIEELP